MQRTNAVAGRLAQELGAHAATDVTGFGFAGHLLTLLEPDDLTAEIESSTLPFLPGAQMLWEGGLRSTAHPANRTGFVSRVEGACEADEAWLFDPQTAGGLLLAIAPERTQAMIQAFEEAGEPPIFRIGRIVGTHSDSTRGSRGQIKIMTGEPLG
jgi:selenide,water dikinase